MGPPLVRVRISVVVFAGAGWAQDRGIWQPLRRRGLGLTQMMIVTIGLALTLQYTYQYFVAASTVKISTESRPRSFGPITSQPVRLWRWASRSW